MRKFLVVILSFCGVLTIIGLGLDYYVSYKLLHNQDRKYVVWNDIINKQLDADLVIMGASRGMVQYNPAILDSILHINTYNISVDGSALNRQILRYEIFNHFQQKKPKCIIVNIDCLNTLDWTYGYEREQFFPYLSESFFRKEVRKVEPFSIAELYVPLYRYTTYKGLAGLLKESSEIYEDVYKGYRGEEREWDGTEFDKIKTYHFRYDTLTLRMFDEFLAARNAEGIQMVFCYAPVYIGLTQKVDNIQEVYNLYQELSDKYNIPILDYNYLDLSMDTTWFYNATHLNKKGADLFSERLAQDIDSLNIYISTR